MPGPRDLLHRLAQHAAHRPAQPGAVHSVRGSDVSVCDGYSPCERCRSARVGDDRRPVARLVGLARRGHGVQLVQQLAGPARPARAWPARARRRRRGARSLPRRRPSGRSTSATSRPSSRRLPQLVAEQVLRLGPGDPHLSRPRPGRSDGRRAERRRARGEGGLVGGEDLRRRPRPWSVRWRAGPAATPRPRSPAHSAGTAASPPRAPGDRPAHRGDRVRVAAVVRGAQDGAARRRRR